MRHVALILAILLLIPAHAFSQTNASWTVQKITGTAYIAQKGADASVVRRGSVLHPGQTLSTQARTRLLLTRGKERIQVGPQAILAIPPSQYNEPGKTLILQQSGRVQVTANVRDVKHFSVKTPYLTAIVKGTIFTVDVARNRSFVSVQRGRVEVSDNGTGNTTEITLGQRATVSVTPSGKRQLNVAAAGKKPAIRQIKAKKAKPNFYATVQVKGKTMALQPGSKKQTTTVEAVRAEVTTTGRSKSSKASNSSNGASSSASRSSYDDSSDDDGENESYSSSIGPGNSNGAGNSSNSNASSTATSKSSDSSSSSSATSSSTSPGNSNGAGNSSNSNASSTATSNSNAGVSNGNAFGNSNSDD
nr:FecR domain-containing protein [uncultured Cohaesibacter sp.]